MQYRALPISALAIVLATPLVAQERPELSYGINFTSNYMSKGATQSDNHPAVQGYVEAVYGTLYGGVWSSTVDFDDEEFGDDSLEFDLYAGIRPTLGDLSVDLSYYRYLYDDTGDCCGEIILALNYPIADFGEIGGEADYDPVYDTKWVELSSSLNFLTDFVVGGTLGTDFGTMDLGEDRVAWDLGVSRGVGEYGQVDLRYYDANDQPARGVLSIAVDF